MAIRQEQRLEKKLETQASMTELRVCQEKKRVPSKRASVDKSKE